jgi:hypothetical protein
MGHLKFWSKTTLFMNFTLVFKEFNLQSMGLIRKLFNGILSVVDAI